MGKRKKKKKKKQRNEEIEFVGNKEGEERKGGKRQCDRKGGEEEGERKKREDFKALRRSKLDSPSTKVGAHSAIYAWILKTWSFDKLHKVGNFPTRYTFSLKAV